MLGSVRPGDDGSVAGYVVRQFSSRGRYRQFSGREGIPCEPTSQRRGRAKNQNSTGSVERLNGAAHARCRAAVYMQDDRGRTTAEVQNMCEKR